MQSVQSISYIFTSFNIYILCIVFPKINLLALLGNVNGLLLNLILLFGIKTAGKLTVSGDFQT